MIDIKNLSKKWSFFSLEDIDLDIKEGEYFVILGPTGAGKTLFLELIAGFHESYEGTILLDGEDIFSQGPEDRPVGFVYQDYSLFPHMTVEENIRFGPEMNDFSEDVIDDKVERIMNILGITHLADRMPRGLSGGEQQKTALARGLVMEPDILLLDEPISSLDVPTQENMREELKRIHEELDITTLHVTHNRGEAAYLGDRIGVMKDGTIVQVGSSEEIFKRPESEFVAEFMGSTNIFDGVSSENGDRVSVDIGSGLNLEAVSDKTGDVKVSLRPEDIRISNEIPSDEYSNVFEGEVVEIMELENTIQIKVDTGVVFVAVGIRRSDFEGKFSIGKDVYLSFDDSAVHLI